jgi:DNA-directed RNA polymerase specialized sigma24 family protein
VVFEMNRVQGLKYAEVAEALGISVKAVEAHMARALRTLTEGELDALGAALGALASLDRHLHSPAG